MNTQEINEILLENRRLRKALKHIAKWHTEFPPTYLSDGTPVSYESQYGSNGAREYMRGIAKEALES